jgi:hypothetical protein
MEKTLNNLYQIRFLFKKIADPFSCYHKVLINLKDGFITNGRGFTVRKDQIIPYVNLKKVILSQSSFLPLLNKFLCEATKVYSFSDSNFNAKIIKETIFDKVLSYYYIEIDNLPIVLLQVYVDFLNILFSDQNFEKKLFLKESIFKNRKYVHYYYVIFDKNKEIVGACQDCVSFVLS